VTIRERLKKHHAVVAFIGATIVLATFIVKDEKRDGLKDQIGS
jgi:hypothetical protein